jgi:Histidine kinase-, DNA gyrase B-, and HSP90-like ATPase
LAITSKSPGFTTAGRSTGTIPVRIAYRIVELFSDGLYASPNKALEELVSNSFDAGASNVHIVMSSDRGASDALIVVVDDGESMNAAGLTQHWLIGESNKRSLKKKPGGREQIGKFGIGKLATFVLASHLTHICKRDGQYFAVTMDYTKIRREVSRSAGEDEDITLPLRTLTEKEAKEALPDILTAGDGVGFEAIKFFGKGGAKSWTVAIMSSLKPMAGELRAGRLGWVLRTAMPLRDDFRLFLNGQPLLSSKTNQPILRRWVLGKDLTTLSKPAPEDLVAEDDPKFPEGDERRYGLVHSVLGRVTGYAEVYEDLLTGQKSEEIGRSNGFFIYVRGRLLNIDDERFGIDPDTLRHGTFARFRAVLYVDRLDEDLRSTREAVREGALTSLARDIAKALFNLARAETENARSSNGTRGRIGGAAGSLTRRPLVGLIQSALEGSTTPRYIRLPKVRAADRKDFIEKFRAAAEPEEGLVAEIRSEPGTVEDGIAVYDVESRTLIVNDLHPFVAAHREDFAADDTLPLIAMAEVLTEAYLLEAGISPGILGEILGMRDDLLRQFARTRRRTAAVTAQCLEDAANDKNELERELVAAFQMLGFDATHIGGPGKPDGVAWARLGAGEHGQQRYGVSLEAKSKERGGTKVSAKTVGVSGIARQRDDNGCDHALVVGPDFEGTGATAVLGAVVKEISADRDKTGKTVTLARIADLARLLRLAPLKGVDLHDLRRLFKSAITPEDFSKWVDDLERREASQAPFRDVLNAIWGLQDEMPDESVEFAAVRVALKKDFKLEIKKTEIERICIALSQLSPAILIRNEKVELTKPPERILIDAAGVLRTLPGGNSPASIFGKIDEKPKKAK